MAAIERKSKRSPTALTGEEWDRIAPLLSRRLAKHGRKPGVDLCEVLNTIRYMTGTGRSPCTNRNPCCPFRW